MEKGVLKSFEELLNIMDELRVKCPWDRKQTFESLKNHSIEEVYELADAILEKDMNNIKKELGDILLHVVFYAKLGSEQQAFDMKDVIDEINKKLIFRHPHVFGDAKVNSTKEVEQNWEKLKLKEKGGNKTVLSGIPKMLPSILKAHRLQQKAGGVGFDWDKKEDVWEKVFEEIKELKVEFEQNDRQKMTEEFGDLMFALINAARLYNIDPDEALEMTNRKFIKRFEYVEKNTIQKGLDMTKMSIDEKEKFWQEAKKNL